LDLLRGLDGFADPIFSLHSLHSQEMPGPGTYKTFEGEAIDRTAMESLNSKSW